MKEIGTAIGWVWLTCSNIGPMVEEKFHTLRDIISDSKVQRRVPIHIRGVLCPTWGGGGGGGGEWGQIWGLGREAKKHTHSLTRSRLCEVM